MRATAIRSPGNPLANESMSAPTVFVLAVCPAPSTTVVCGTEGIAEHDIGRPRRIASVLS